LEGSVDRGLDLDLGGFAAPEGVAAPGDLLQPLAFGSAVTARIELGVEASPGY